MCCHPDSNSEAAAAAKWMHVFIFPTRPVRGPSGVAVEDDVYCLLRTLLS